MLFRSVQVRLCPAFAVTAGLFYALALAIALFEQPQVVLHVFVAGILALCGRERRVRALVVTTQHVREALVVENLDGRSNDADRLTIGAVGEIKPAQAIVGGGKADPGFGIARMLLDRGTEMLFGKTVVARAEIFLAEIQLIVGVAAEQTLHRFARHTDLLDDRAGRVVGCLCGVRDRKSTRLNSSHPSISY